MRCCVPCCNVSLLLNALVSAAAAAVTKLLCKCELVGSLPPLCLAPILPCYCPPHTCPAHAYPIPSLLCLFRGVWGRRASPAAALVHADHPQRVWVCAARLLARGLLEVLHSQPGAPCNRTTHTERDSEAQRDRGRDAHTYKQTYTLATQWMSRLLRWRQRERGPSKV